MESLVAPYKELAVTGMEMFLRNFSHVPDDKLNWTPTPTAKSALRIAAHTALYAGRFARMLEARALPKHDNIEAWLVQRNAEEAAITNRSDIETIFRKGTEEALAALDSLTAEEVEKRLDTGFGGSVPMTFLMNLPGVHAMIHMGQIDFLQTCWDDQHVYVE